MERLNAAFAEEERRGLWLAFRLRLVALALIATYLAVVSPWPQVLYYHALMLSFVVTGALSLLPARGLPGAPAAEWTRWVVPVADLAIVTFALAFPNPFGGDEWITLPMRLRLDNMLYPLLVVALSTLSYSPRQVLWTGFVAVVFWAGATLWVANSPGTKFVPIGGLTSEVIVDPMAVLAQLALKQGFLLLVVCCLLTGAVARSRAIALRQVKAERERTQLARYFSPNLVEQLADADRDLGEVRQQTVAVMFADIVGSTTLAEGEPPTAVIGMLRQFHERMQAAVFAHGGTLDKYLGDGLMATFGTPDPGPRDAANALACARAMMASLELWNAERAAAGQSGISLSIGIHWGPVVLGDVGGDSRLEFATVGDAVNVASRLETITRDFGADIIVSADLAEAVRAVVPAIEAAALLEGFESSDPQRLRGRNAPLEILARRRSAGTVRPLPIDPRPRLVDIAVARSDGAAPTRWSQAGRAGAE
ncbi:MAG: adenylate/guanylate cyclase domain-containing protein [Bauldia sp.]